MTRRQKYLTKEIRAYILVIHVTDGDTWLHYLGGIDVSYFSDIAFERLDDGYTTNFLFGMIFEFLI